MNNFIHIGLTTGCSKRLMNNNELITALLYIRLKHCEQVRGLE